MTAQAHTLSVDEVQDLTPAQIMLLKFLCDDAEHGFLLAGDTAQTIAHGVNFRLQVRARLGAARVARCCDQVGLMGAETYALAIAARGWTLWLQACCFDV